MKVSLLSIVLLCSAICCFSKDAEGQDDLQKRITLKVNNKEVKSVLTDMEKLASVKFLYSAEYIQPSRKISLNVKDKKLGDVLTEMLTPLRISYHAEKNGYIFLDRIEEPSVSISSVAPEAIPVKGIIRDHEGQPLRGVTVKVKDGTASALTNEK